jgi:hypothetical protein
VDTSTQNDDVPTQPTEKAEENDRLTLKIDYRIAVGYGFLLAFAYQFGYWRPFGVPIFEYASFSDLLRFSVWPVTLTVIAPLLLPALNVLLDNTPPLSDRARRWWHLVLVGIASALLVLATWFDDPSRFLLYGIMVGSSLWLAAKRYIFLANVPTRIYRALLLFLASAPAWAWGVGAMNADMILKGQRYSEATITKDEGVNAEVDSSTELRVLGRTESYVFFWVPSRSHVLMIAVGKVTSMQVAQAGKYVEAAKVSAQENVPTGHKTIGAK